MTVEGSDLLLGTPFSHPATEVVVRDANGNVVMFCVRHGDGVLAAHAGDDDFEQLLDIHRLKAPVVRTIRAG